MIDPKTTAATALRAASAAIGLATIAAKEGPYAWIPATVQAIAACAADVLEAEPIETAKGRNAIIHALVPVFDSLPRVSRADSEELALGIVTAIRVVRRWVS